MGVFVSEFGISAAYNDDAVNDTFAFLETGIDATTGYDQFSDNIAAEQGFGSISGDDTFTLNFDGTGWNQLTLTYAMAPTEGGTFTVINVDLGHLDGVELASYSFTPAAGASYDNFAITGVVPEPSAFAAIFGAVALGVAATRRRK
ncbi:MAG: hypothetical protein CML13_17675 [Puniceicoccaceae bacterium]|nr:hypothetical protein [Puniceicoccaceae bacterium]|tara:strand:- start:574 stop:1011 length:438 start_codon:yes stop_codon:yes gene_type:complete